MRNLILLFLIANLGQIIGIEKAYALSQCMDPNYRHNCLDSIKASDGTKYLGNFKNNKLHGQGTLTFPNGAIYVGTFKNDKLSGQGAFTYPNGTKHVGEYRQNKPNGQGILYYNNGDKYVGIFRKGKRHGEGRMIFANGEIKEGDWDNGKLIPTESTKASKSGGMGSGFFVSQSGHLITNEHVVKGCGNITIRDSSGLKSSVSLIETDRRTDLALLRTHSPDPPPSKSQSFINKLAQTLAPIGSQSLLSPHGLLRPYDAKVGEEVLVAGFPYGALLSDTIKVTKGIVSARNGLADDNNNFQIDAAVQSGNSGGPIYDEKGNVIGVVVQRLNKIEMLKVTGSLPENISFGIKASTIRQFLNSAGLPSKWKHHSQRRSTQDLAKIAKSQTVMVVCHP
jgi:S1-C subfamily serine protease